MIEAVFWDFGGVFTASPFHAVRPYSALLGIAHDELLDLVFGPYHLDTDHPWHRLERGEGTLAAAMAAAATAAQERGVAFDARAFFGAMRDDIDRTIVVDTVRELRALGVRNCIVTNNAKEFADSWRTLIPVDELFDDVVDSSAVGLRKPNPAIYELALLSLFWNSAVFWLWILPVLLAQPFLRLYLLAEHGDCPQVANMLENTRTTFTNRVVRFVAWNMPYHAEHHCYPAVPFHNLPALHDIAREQLQVTAPGYVAFSRDYLARRP